MTSLIRLGAGCVILAGPTALSFFAGGYFDAARRAAALGAWLLVVIAALQVTGRSDLGSKIAPD